MLLADDAARLVHELPHALEVALAAERRRASRPRLAMILSSTTWAAIDAWSTPGSHSVGWPCMRARRIIRSSTVAVSGVADVERAGHVGRRLDDHERLLAPVGAAPAPSGANTSASSHALVDRAARSRPAGRPAAISAVAGSRLVRWRSSGRASATQSPPETQNAPLVQRTNGVVVPPAGSAPGGRRLIPSTAALVRHRPLSARYRAPPVTARGRRSRPRASAGFQPSAGPLSVAPVGRYSFRSSPWPRSVAHNATAESRDARSGPPAPRQLWSDARPCASTTTANRRSRRIAGAAVDGREPRADRGRRQPIRGLPGRRSTAQRAPA